ncbi:MAG: Hpt domain-containing protein [Treponema sp.]|jgi:HPt (histidine-containing phosphotransfer) domain-containing protein|nr:Hpt domain-containing protein [Treponema sp.]
MAGEGVVYINWAEGLKRIVNNAKLYIKMLTKMKSDCAQWMVDLSAQLESGDMKAAQGSAHTIKGTSANLALTELNKQVLELEIQIKAKNAAAESAGADLEEKRPGDYDESMKAQFAALNAAYEATMKAIDEVIAQYG